MTRPRLRRRRARSDEGFGLVEELVAIAIMGIGVVALLAGLATLLKASAAHKQASQADHALTIAAEALADSTVPYSQCAGADTTTGPYRTAINNALNAASSPRAVAYTVEYWGLVGGVSGFQATCHDTDPQVPTFERLQKITLSVSDAGPQFSMTVMRRPL